MKHNKYVYIIALVFMAQNVQIISMTAAQKAGAVVKAKANVKAPVAPAVKAPAKVVVGPSQTEGYLKALAPSRSAAYAKVKKVLTAPPVDKEIGKVIENVPNQEIDPQAFAPIIEQVIKSEKENPGYFAFYQGATKENLLAHLVRTYISQIENGWTRNDFVIVRSPDTYYKKPAKSAADYIKQNMPYILEQFIPKPGSTDQNCVFGNTVGCSQFDFVEFPVKGTGNWRNHLVSTSPSFIGGVDDTPQELREMYDEDRAAWESAFYYFASGMSWSTFRRLYGILVADLKKSSPSLFANKAIDIQIRKYIAIKMSNVADILFPNAAQAKRIAPGSAYDIYSKAGMMFQFLIPANIVDDVVYLSWQNGPLWQRKINGISDGWDDSIGAYTKVSPILTRLQTDPLSLGRAINLLQTRIILKDEKYFNDPRSPVKINIIHTLQPSLFQSIEDSLRAIARVVVEYKKSGQKQQAWFEQTDIANAVKVQEANLAELLASNNENDQIKAMNILYYFAATGVDVQRAKQMAGKYKNSGNAKLKILSEAIDKLAIK